MSETIQLVGPSGISAGLTRYGARLTGLVLPDVDGAPRDVVLGFDTVEEYRANPNLFFGATIGRVANRISGARFTLDGADYALTANEDSNHLHGGGPRRFDQVTWQVEIGNASSARFNYFSPHLEEGYPGDLEAEVEYRVTNDGLEIEYRARVDRRTPVNMTHHTYWNLNGVEAASTIDDHLLEVHAERFNPIDDALIPLGHLVSVDGSPLDFRSPAPIGERADALRFEPGEGVDHNFAIDGWDSSLRLMARVAEPSSKLVMEVLGTQPGLQVYSGNHLGPTRGKHGVVYPTRGAMCLEPQHFPDSVHHPGFPTTILEPGEEYRQTTVYRFTAT